MLIYKLSCLLLVAGIVEKLVTGLEEKLYLDVVLAIIEGAAFLYIVNFLAERVVL